MIVEAHLRHLAQGVPKGRRRCSACGSEMPVTLRELDEAMPDEPIHIKDDYETAESSPMPWFGS